MLIVQIVQVVVFAKLINWRVLVCCVAFRCPGLRSASRVGLIKILIKICGVSNILIMLRAELAVSA